MGSTIFHIIWALALSTSLYALDNLDAIFNSDRVPIATLDRMDGSGRVRLEDLSLWRNLFDDQKFYEGDVISTNTRSNIRIKFDNGRVLDIGENSLISLSQSTSSNKSEILVTLIQGNIASSANSSTRAKGENAVTGQSLRFLSGGTNIQLAGRSTSIQLSKSATSKKAAIKVVSGQATVRQVGGKVRQLKKNESIGKTTAITSHKDMLASLVPGRGSMASAGSWVIPGDDFKPATFDLPNVLNYESGGSKSGLSLLSAPVASLDPLAPTLVWPPSQGYIWTQKSLKLKTIGGIRIALRSDSKNVASGWQNILRVMRPRNKALSRTYGFEGGSRVLYRKFSGREFLSQSLVVSGFKIKTHAVSLRPGLMQLGAKASDVKPGARSDNDNFLALSSLSGIHEKSQEIKGSQKSKLSKGKIVYSKESTIRMRSFADLPRTGYEINLARINPKKLDAHTWVEQARISSYKQSDPKIFVRSKRRLLNLLPLFHGSKHFQLEPKTIKFRGEGIYFVHNLRVVAKLDWLSFELSRIREIARLFDAELVYLGNAHALLRGVRDFNALQTKAKKFKSVKNFYLFDSGKLVRIRSSLVRRDPKVIQSLFGNLDALFIEKVKILSFTRQ